jgi:hypothetical protein
MSGTASTYQPRKPQESQYYQCVEDHFERLEQVYDEIFARRYGFFRPHESRLSIATWIAASSIMASPV